MSRNRRKAGAVALLCILASPAYAWHLDSLPQGTSEGQDSLSQYERRQRRAEHQQLRDALRDRQREGLATTGGLEPDSDAHGRRMSPEERRRFRRDINDAGRQVYGPAGPGH